MCSRFTLTSPVEAVRSYFRHVNILEYPPRYNIAPTQPVHIIRHSHKGARELALVRWGLIPSWVKDPAQFSTLINARSETAAEKPSFRSALRYRRCLIPASGFYEWTGPKGAKQPHLIRPIGQPDVWQSTAAGTPWGEVMALAGLWEHWMSADGSEMESMAILTTAANTTMAKIHDRMPLILQPGDFDRWLDCSMGRAEAVDDLLPPPADGHLEVLPVSRKLNSSRNEGRDVFEPMPPDLLG